MGLRGRLRRLEKDAEQETITIRLKDGTTARFYEDEVFPGCFMHESDRGRRHYFGEDPGPAHPFVEALRPAGPGDLARGVRVAFASSFLKIWPFRKHPHKAPRASTEALGTIQGTSEHRRQSGQRIPPAKLYFPLRFGVSPYVPRCTDWGGRAGRFGNNPHARPACNELDDPQREWQGRSGVRCTV